MTTLDLEDDKSGATGWRAIHFALIVESTASCIFSQSKMLSGLVYQPLDVAQKEIRILYVEVEDELDSTSSSTPPPISTQKVIDKPLEGPRVSQAEPTLRFRLATVSLLDLDVPFYEAISYCWNDSKEHAQLFLDGFERKVPAKAESTLRAICDDHGHTPVWLDAICINQDDPEEKAQQAEIMAEVYAKAARVLIWLGNGGGFAGRATSAVRELRGTIDEEFPIDWKTPHSWPTGPGMTDMVLRRVPSINSWQAVYSLFANRWFTRAWIIKEVTMSKQVICYLGHYRMDWSDLASLATWLHRESNRLPFNPGEGSLAGMANVEDVWIMQCRESKILANLQELVSSFDRKEPEDLSQAILELRLSDARVTGSRPRAAQDYDEPMSDIYARAARAVIVEKGNLSLLKHAQSLRALSGREKHDDFPSWALRLDLRDYSFLNPISCRSFQFNADDSIPLCLSTSENPRVLRAQGVLLETITEVSPRMHWPLRGNRHSDAATAATVMRKTFSWTREALPNWPEAALARKFAFTVAAGQDAGGRNLATARAYGKRLHRGFMDIAPISIVYGPLRSENTIVTSADLNRDALYTVEAMMKSGQNRTIFTTDQGRLGLGTDNLLPGDKLCILFGGNVPFVLRPDGEYWRFIGDAFVEGIMFVSLHGRFASCLRHLLTKNHRVVTFMI